MNINELARPKTIDAAMKILYKAGYRMDGDGGFARVFSKQGENTVLKLFKSTDKAYIHFVYFCLKHNGNPNLPKFRGKLMKITDKYYAVRMEKLSKLSNNFDINDFNMVHLISKAFSYALEPEAERSGNELTGFKGKIYQEDFENLKHIDKNLANTIFELGKWCKKNKPMNDLHSANIMKRGNIYVITDPIAYGNYE